MEDGGPSQGYQHRIEVGRRLAALPDVSGERQALLALLLDPEDTAVSLATAEALLARGDDAGVGLVLRAAAGADDDTLQWLATALLNHAFDNGEGPLRERCARAAASGGPESKGWQRLR